jgi:hypothetical protein
MINNQFVSIDSLKNSSGGLNARAVERLFENKELIDEMLKDISHLDVNSKRPEILYCYFNKIKENPKCPCDNNCKFESYTTGYRKSCVKCFREVYTEWDVTQAMKTRAELNSNDYESFKVFLTSDEKYKKFSIDEIKLHTENILKIRPLNKLISYSDYVTERDYLKSIVEETNYFEIGSTRKCIKGEFNWTNRLYNILNGLTEFPKCIICKTNRCSFLNLYKGYNQTCKERACMAELASMNRRLELFTSICEKVKLNGFILDIDLSDKSKLPRLSKNRIKITCIKCKDVFERGLDAGSWKRIFCYNCSGKMVGSSHEEKYLLHKIRKDYDGEILENHKHFKESKNTKHEMDIYLPEKKIAFEYNGLYWHSFGVSGKKIEKEEVQKDSAHLKSIWCMEDGIQLYTIFSNETLLVDKNAIWESKIKYIFNKNERIHARKCKIVEVAAPDNELFLNKNHLSGEVHSSIRIGLEYNGELVFVMNFCKPRFNKKYQYELVRFCNKINTTVVGGVSKLFSYFVKKYNPNDIISYCDLRFSVGKVYGLLKFKKNKINPPSYNYVSSGGAIVSRYIAESTTFINKLENYNKSITIKENLLNNKYRRLWDCGNILFTWNK